MGDRTVTSLPAPVAQWLRDRAARDRTTLDQVVGRAYRDYAARLREGWRPPGPEPPGAGDPFARPGAGQGVPLTQVAFRGFGPAALAALDELASELGLTRTSRSGLSPNRSAVIALLVTAATEES
jgi:hypothetical protein